MLRLTRLVRYQRSKRFRLKTLIQGGIAFDSLPYRQQPDVFVLRFETKFRCGLNAVACRIAITAGGTSKGTPIKYQGVIKMVR
ncbi:hypothetical protein OH492_25515 [Vibrio chagasii]|nr:hypothetical protein [Vibrio chagasii]